MTAIDRYIARLVFVPLVATLTIAAMLLILDRMLRLFDFVATEDVSGMQAILQLKLTDGTNVGTPITCTVGAYTTSTPIACPTPGREITAFQGIALTVAQ